MNRGFTVVEVLVTLVIISIILGLGTIGLRSSLGNARDSERLTDIETIARGLENRYKNGNAKVTGSNATYTLWLNKGQYPGAAEFLSALGFPKGEFTPATVSGGYMTELLGASQAALDSPTSTNVFDVICSAPSGAGTCGLPANDTAAIDAKLGTGDRYLYIPYDTNGNTCYGIDCVGFFLYWRDDAGVRQGPFKSIRR